MFRRVDTILLFSHVFPCLRRKLIRETVLSFNKLHKPTQAVKIWLFPFAEFIVRLTLHKLHNPHDLTFGTNKIAGHILLVLEMMSNANRKMTMIQHGN
jgi:hypothetical protein